MYLQDLCGNIVLDFGIFLRLDGQANRISLIPNVGYLICCVETTSQGGYKKNQITLFELKLNANIHASSNV